VDREPTVVLLHGGITDTSSWNEMPKKARQLSGFTKHRDRKSPIGLCVDALIQEFPLAARAKGYPATR
jgi:hypothetical protein